MANLTRGFVTSCMASALLLVPAGQCGAAVIDNLYSGTLANGGSFEGRFAGDTGADDTLTDSELTLFTLSTTNVNDGITTLVDGSADLNDILSFGFPFFFGYSATANAFTVGPEFAADPFGYGPFFNSAPLSFQVGATPTFFDDLGNAASVEILSLSITAVPEPGSVVLCGLGGAMLLSRFWRGRSDSPGIA